MKTLLVCLVLCSPISVWAMSSQSKCQALLTSQGVANSDSPFKSEISRIVGATVPSLYDDLKIKLSWGEMDSLDYLMIKKDEPATHASLPRIPNPSAWENPKAFSFMVVVLGSSTRVYASSIKRYKINAYSLDGRTSYVLAVDASHGDPVDLLNLYVALSAAPFVNAVVFEQEILPKKLSYPNGPIPLSDPEELRAIRNFRQLDSDMKKREEAAMEVKPGIVKALQDGKQLEYRGIVITGFSNALNVVPYSKATSFILEYFFKVPSGRRTEAR